MTPPRPQHRRMRHDPLGELRRQPRRVDFTAPIMARLGLPAAGTRAARVAMVRRWGGRTLLAAALVFAVATGFLIHAQSERARRPAGPSLPAAIRNDLDRHQHAITATLQTIRQLQPRLLEPAAEPGPRRTVPASATPWPAPAPRPDPGPDRGAQAKDRAPASAPDTASGSGGDPDPGNAHIPDPEHSGRGQA